MDIELRAAVVPFEAWVDGDFLPFAKMFPTMVLQILACKKPNIERYMLLQLERLLRYEKTHPDVLETIALNCAYLDEEDIEFLNALMGRLGRRPCRGPAATAGPASSGTPRRRRLRSAPSTRCSVRGAP